MRSNELAMLACTTSATVVCGPGDDSPRVAGPTETAEPNALASLDSLSVLAPVVRSRRTTCLNRSDVSPSFVSELISSSSWRNRRPSSGPPLTETESSWSSAHVQPCASWSANRRRVVAMTTTGLSSECRTIPCNTRRHSAGMVDSSPGHEISPRCSASLSTLPGSFIVQTPLPDSSPARCRKVVFRSNSLKSGVSK